MTMVPDSDDPNQKLLRLLALKRHELPPPGFFARLPQRVLLQIRADAEEGPWYRRFWRAISQEPMVVGSYAALGAGALVFGVSVFQMALDRDNPAFIGFEGMTSTPPGVSIVTAPTLPSGVIYSMSHDYFERPAAMGITADPFDSGLRSSRPEDHWRMIRVSLNP